MTLLRWMFTNEQGRMGLTLAALCAAALLLGNPNATSVASQVLGWALTALSLLLPLYSRVRRG